MELFTAREIAWRRLANQRLVGSPLASPVAVVRHLGAVQAQDYAGAKWGVARRSAGATEREIETAVDSGAIVRTHVLRPTWHFVAAEDIRWMLALTAPRIRKMMSSYDPNLALDEKVYARSGRAIEKALSGGRQLTRAELGRILGQARIGVASGQRLAHLMMRAELDGLVCSGARRGNQSTYALLEERVAASRVLERDEAIAELATRYFSTRGPATVHDFAWWSGLTVGVARQGVDWIAGSLRSRALDGATYWFTGDAPAPERNLVHLLPNYDEYFIGLKDRSAISGKVQGLLGAGPTGVFSAHVVTIEGQLAGGWKRAKTGRTPVVEVVLAVNVTRTQERAIAHAAERLGDFLGTDVGVRIRPKRP